MLGERYIFSLPTHTQHPLILSPSRENKRGREPTAEERQWFQEKIPGRWVARFASGATTVFELKVTEVMKPMRAFCGLEEDDEYTQMRWLTSAHACGGKKSPVNDIALVKGAATSDEASLNGALQGGFSVYAPRWRPDHIHLWFTIAGDSRLSGTLESNGTVMRGSAAAGPLAKLGAFEARRESAIPKPVIQEPR